MGSIPNPANSGKHAFLSFNCIMAVAAKLRLTTATTLKDPFSLVSWYATVVRLKNLSLTEGHKQL